MKTLAEIDNTIDALKEVSSNALLKHGFSRSRQRIFDLSKSLDQSWQNYFSKIHEVRYTELINIYKECNFDHVWTFDDIVEKESCKALISSVVTLPNDFDKLFDKYMFLNPPDVQLDKRIHELISST